MTFMFDSLQVTLYVSVTQNTIFLKTNHACALPSSHETTATIASVICKLQRLFSCNVFGKKSLFQYVTAALILSVCVRRRCRVLILQHTWASLSTLVGLTGSDSSCVLHLLIMCLAHSSNRLGLSRLLGTYH